MAKQILDKISDQNITRDKGYFMFYTSYIPSTSQNMLSKNWHEAKTDKYMKQKLINGWLNN